MNEVQQRVIANFDFKAVKRYNIKRLPLESTLREVHMKAGPESRLH